MSENHESRNHDAKADLHPEHPNHEGARRRRSILKPAIVVGAITAATWVVPRIVSTAKAAGALSPA